MMMLYKQLVRRVPSGYETFKLVVCTLHELLLYADYDGFIDNEKFVFLARLLVTLRKVHILLYQYTNYQLQSI